ncbi:hypothetical protein DFH06DRAFT_1463979 [Mycena polygramma]|nr:hypothetical protein DFH06DRAFT_1463979 [Mycena polygramma]
MRLYTFRRRQVRSTSKHNAPVLPHVCLAPRCAEALRSGGDHPDTIYRLPESGFRRLWKKSRRQAHPHQQVQISRNLHPAVFSTPRRAPRSGAHSLETMYRRPAIGLTYLRQKAAGGQTAASPVIQRLSSSRMRRLSRKRRAAAPITSRRRIAVPRAASQSSEKKAAGRHTATTPAIRRDARFQRAAWTLLNTEAIDRVPARCKFSL